MRSLIILIAVFAIGIGVWFLLRDDGVIEQVTEARVEQALLDNGVPVNLSECMAEKLVDRLSIGQLLKLERLAPEEGEESVPRSAGAALTRLRRVDDNEAVEQVVRIAGRCSIDLIGPIF